MKCSLRIFLCFQQSLRRHAVPAVSYWADYFRHGLAEAGHVCLEARECDWAEGLLPLTPEAAHAWRERTWSLAVEHLRREHARQPVDLFLGHFIPRQILPSAVAEIRALGIPCVHYFCDNIREFSRVPDEFDAFDLHWVPEHDALALYRRKGLRCFHAPMPCWVPPVFRTPVERETLPVTFVGTRDEQRERLFAEAVTLGLEVDLRGTGWIPAEKTFPPPARTQNPFTLIQRQVAFARQHGWTGLARKLARSLRRPAAAPFDFAPLARPAPAGDAYWEALRQSMVCLGVSRFPSFRFPVAQPGRYSRLRDIEAPMAGACYLTEAAPGLDELYDLGTEIETYATPAELAEKCRALAADAPRRKELRAHGQRRALADHTIPRTIQRLAEHLAV